MAGDAVLLKATQAGVATITLNRPALHNAFDAEVIESLSEILEDLAGAEGLRGKADERLIAFDRSTYKVQRERLVMLADAFGTNSPALRKIVQDYIVKYLPATPDESGPGESAGDGNGENNDGKD